MMKYLIAALVFVGLVSANTAYADGVQDFLGGVYAQPGVFLSQQPTEREDWWGRAPHTRYNRPALPANGHTWRASFYGGGPKRFEPNTHTANGERFNQWDLTAAHRTLPMGTMLHVCYRGCAVVRVNDRGPAAWTGRSLDLSRGAATQIGLIKAGSAPVRVTVIN